jgi:hypothetical protein
MTELYRFAAFISYSSKDAAFARQLHGALERYHIPTQLGAFDLIGGGKKNRIFPVFRDREELPSGDLGEAIETALKASSALIVICSPNAAASPWVNKEIESFLAMGRRDRIFAIIQPNAPLVDDQGRDATSACFPPAFRGKGLDGGLEPIAGDVRKGRDGFRNAWLKVVAGLIGVNAGALQDRDRKRQRMQRLRTGLGVTAASLALALGGAVVDTQSWRTRFSTYAEALASEKRPLDAVTFALAGVSPRGSVIAAQSDRADATLARVSAARILDYLNASRDLDFSTEEIMPRADLMNRFSSPASFPNRSFNATAGFPFDVLGVVGQIRQTLISADGNTLVTQAENNQVVAYRMVDGFAPLALGDLGSINQFLLSDNGNTLFAWTEENQAMVFDLLRGGTKTSLGTLLRLESMDLTADGKTLIIRSIDNRGAIYRLSGGDTMDLDDLSLYALSGDGKTLVTITLDGQGAVHNLTKVDAGTTIGDLGLVRYADVSVDGKVLFVFTVDGDGAFYDLASPVWQGDPPSGEKLSSAVCVASGPALRPFNPALRDPDLPRSDEADRKVYASLQGRPWNPCDWRGIAAIFPDRVRGDGWFEGLRQWLRLVHVRYLGGSDYACEDTTTRATAETRVARADLCARFAASAILEERNTQ